MLLLGLLLRQLRFHLVFNLWLIPTYGIDGAAIASFTAFFIYNTLKLVYVKAKFKIVPFTHETWKVFALLIVVGVLFTTFSLPFHSIINITIKSLLMIITYLGILYRFKISEDVFIFLSKYLSK